MSVETNQVGDQSGGASGDAGKNSGDVVKYETYQKTVSEVKTLKSRNAELLAEKEAREQEALAQKGNFEEAAKRAKEAQKVAEDALAAKDKAYAKTIFNKEVKAIASQLGARPEALEDIVKVGSWETIEIDDDFNVNQEQVKQAILNLSKAKPFYFTKVTPGPNDVNTSTGGNHSGNKKVEDMSVDEIKAQLRSLK